MEAMFGISAIIIAVVGLLFQHFGVIARIKEEMGRENTLIRERISALETKTDLFWKIVETEVAERLKSPAHKRKDDLLDKMKAHSLTLEEAEELAEIVKAEYNNPHERKHIELGYILVIGRLEQIMHELRAKE